MAWNCLTVGELRKALASLPDDTQVVIDGVEEDCEASELYLRRKLPPALDQPGLVVLGPGQVITYELDYHVRLDVWLEHRSSEAWNSKEQAWRRR